MPMQKSRNAPSDMIVANCNEHTIRDNNHQGYQQLMVHLWEKEPSLSCLSWEAWLFIYERPFREKYAMGRVIYTTERHFCLHSWSFRRSSVFSDQTWGYFFEIPKKKTLESISAHFGGSERSPPIKYSTPQNLRCWEVYLSISWKRCDLSQPKSKCPRPTSTFYIPNWLNYWRQ